MQNKFILKYIFLNSLLENITQLIEEKKLKLIELVLKKIF